MAVVNKVELSMSIHHNSPGTGHHGLPGAENPILRHLGSYWQSLRHARHIPARNEIAPQGVDAALPYAFILQRVGPGVARMRVAGQKIHELLCMDARGMPVSVLFAPNSREQLRALVDAHHPGRMLLAEANQWPEDVRDYFGDGDECHMAYHFPLMPRMYMAIAQEDRHPIANILDQTPEIPESCQWAIFLRNHDELTLEMVTDKERDYLWDAYASDSRARINLGIRRRLAPLLQNDRRKIELMNAMLLSMPGTPVIYYGDEIGMGDNIYLGDRDGVRTPMQWSPDRNGGFSRANPQQLYLPTVMDPVYGFQAVNVESQQGDPSNTANNFQYHYNIRPSLSSPNQS